MNLPQVIPSEFCLKCRGCCVFREADSRWCARLMVEEEILLEKRVPGLSFGGRVRTEPCSAGCWRCRCLEAQSHRCRVYADRPLECALYPFLLSSEEQRLRLYAHLACPWVVENQGSPEWSEHIATLMNFFALPLNVALLKAAQAAYPDYSVFTNEAKVVAEIPFVDGAGVFRDHRAKLDRWFGCRKAVLSSNSLVSAFAWSGLFDFTLEEVDGNGLLFARQHGAKFLYCPPLGEKISPRATAAAFARMNGGAARIEAVAIDELAAFDKAVYLARWQGGEYYYERGRIAALAGNEYRSRRSDINGFLKRHRPVFRPFRSADLPACADLFDRWLDNRRALDEDDLYRAMLVENRQVHRRMIQSAVWLGLIGRVVEVDGVLAGYTFGYRLNEETFCVALEVTAPAFRGLPAFIFREFCADAALAPFKYINAMDDSGMPGVARAKHSWRPVFMEKVYSVCIKP